MKLKPIEYIWLCQKHYDERCVEIGHKIPIQLLHNSFGWQCKKCAKRGEYLIIDRVNISIERWD